MSDNTPTPVEIPLAQSRAFGLPPADNNGLNVTRLHVPLPAVITLLVFMAGGVISVTGVWFRLAAHAEAHEAHIDPTEATRGGGVAYRNEVTAVRTDLTQAKGEIERRTRKLLKSMEISCHKNGDGLKCKVELPEGE